MNDVLKRLNFNDLLQFDSGVELSTYDFKTHQNNGLNHPVKGYCLRCEAKGCNTCPGSKDFSLTNISHGASTDEILQATGQVNADFSGWHNEGVLFLMEGPSKDYDLYGEVEFNGYKKKPAKSWYWIHEEQDAYHYPDQFKGGVYGPLFNSIVFTFKLKNAYITNLVKCGLNDSYDNYKGIQHYNPETIKTCYESFLTKEIEAINPKVIFCFGRKVHNFLSEQYADAKFPWQVISLPHPARGQSGFSHELFRHSYYSMILEGLYQAGIVTIDEAQYKYSDFLKLSNRGNDD